MVWLIIGGLHQSGISCYKHLLESSNSTTWNVNSPMCYHGCHFVYKLEWGHKATKLPVFAPIAAPISQFDQIFLPFWLHHLMSLATTTDQTICGHPYTELYSGMFKGKRVINVEGCWKTMVIITRLPSTCHHRAPCMDDHKLIGQRW